jgi:dephospho-CoA kinase
VLRIALTGGIATGKSYVLSRFRDLGVPALDADEIAHGVTAAGTEATTAIAKRFGNQILDSSGAVDRGKLGRIVFGDAGARRDLEGIVHPAVRRSIEAGLRALERLGSPLAIVDIPLLFETGRSREFDGVIATVCPEPLQVQRLIDRGLTEHEARQRIAAQIPAEDKAARADYVIRTDGSFEATDREIESVLSALNERVASRDVRRPGPSGPGR